MRPRPLRRSPLRTFLPIILAPLLAVAAAGADELLLIHGDRLTGKVVRLEGEVLTFVTSWAGEIEIAWGAVATLTTEEDLTLVLEDETLLRGPLAASEAGTTLVAAEGAPEPLRVELARVEAINPMEVRPRRLSGNIRFSLASTGGNTDTDSRVLDGQLRVRTREERYTLGATFNQAEEDGRETADRTSLSGSYDRFFGGRWYLDANARLTEDEFQDLDRRTSLGAAAGYQFREDPDHRLSLELGLSYVDEDFLAARDRSFSAARWALDFDWPFFVPTVRVFHTQEGLLDLDDTSDWIVQTRTGFRFTVFKSFVAATQLNFDFDHRPAPGREQEDRSLLLSLGYEW